MTRRVRRWLLKPVRLPQAAPMSVTPHVHAWIGSYNQATDTVDDWCGLCGTTAPGFPRPAQPLIPLATWPALPKEAAA